MMQQPKFIHLSDHPLSRAVQMAEIKYGSLAKTPRNSPEFKRVQDERKKLKIDVDDRVCQPITSELFDTMLKELKKGRSFMTIVHEFLVNEKTLEKWLSQYREESGDNTDWEREVLTDLYESGVRVCDIVEQLETSGRRATVVLHDLLMHDIVELTEKGKTHQEVADILGVSKRLVTAYVRKNRESGGEVNV